MSNLQLFTEPGGDGGGSEGGDGAGAGGNPGNNNNTTMSFDEFLALEGNQSEFDRRVQKAVNTAVTNAQTKWKTLTDDKVSEAEKLAQMTNQFKFGMGFLREANKLTVVPVQGMPGTTKEIGARYLIASVVVDQEPNALVDLLDLANEGENPRVTKAMLDSYIDSEEVDIDELMEKTKDFLSKANATKKAVKEILKEYEEQMAKKKAQEL